MIKKKTAKEIIAESFKDVAQSKNINKITVKDITLNCGYSPATFYREFKDKYDLISWIHERDVEDIMGQIGADYKWNQTLYDGAYDYENNRDYYINLFKNTSDYNAFEKCMTDIHYRHLKKCVMKHLSEIELTNELDLYMRIYCMGTVKFCREWILGGVAATPREVAAIWEKSLPSPLYPYLYD